MPQQEPPQGQGHLHATHRIAKRVWKCPAHNASKGPESIKVLLPCLWQMTAAAVYMLPATMHAMHKNAPKGLMPRPKHGCSPWARDTSSRLSQQQAPLHTCSMCLLSFTCLSASNRLTSPLPDIVLFLVFLDRCDQRMPCRELQKAVLKGGVACGPGIPSCLCQQRCTGAVHARKGRRKVYASR